MRTAGIAAPRARPGRTSAPPARAARTSAPRARANRASGRQAALALAALLALSGSLLLALAAGAAARLPWEELRLHLVARSWPEAQATIRSVSLSEHSHPAGDRPVTKLVLAVAYDYEADGVAHEGRAASFADTGDPHDRRLRTLYSRLNFALVTGRSVPVFYDPHAPATAVLDRSLARRPAALDGGLAALGALCGLWLLVASLRLGWPRRRPAQSSFGR